MKASNIYFDINYIQSLFSYELIEVVKGEILFREGEINNNVFFIKSGKLKVSKKENVIGFTRENEFIGITSCLCEGNYFYFTSCACENSILLKIDKTNFKKALTDNPEFGKIMIEILCRRIKITDNKTKSYATHNTEERILNELINNAVFECDTQNTNLSIAELSELTGVSTVKVSTVLQGLSANNIIKIIDQRISIVDLETLKLLID